MHLKVNRPIILFLVLGLIININLFSVNNSATDLSGFVINSPLYSNFTEIDKLSMENMRQQSFIEQLGLQSVEKVIDNNIMLLSAISDSNYPITPGDTFQVDYLEGYDTKQLLLQVDSEYNVNIPLITQINAENMKLTTLVEAIKQNISTYYAFSSPQVTLISLGIFSVDVLGEVTSSSTYSVNGLTKLSEVVLGASEYANTRDVEIKDKHNNIKHYDLYLALKKGQSKENPLLKAGDTVILKPAEKTVNVYGQVYKPGTYQVKASDTLETILNYYAGGLLPSADKNNLIINRYDNEENQYQEIKASIENQEINNLDNILVKNIKIEKSSISIEGAIREETTNSYTTSSLLGMARGSVIYNFFPGETLENMLETISSRFSSTSDLTNSYLIRDNKKINVDILSYLLEDVNDDFVLKSGDKLIIPFDQKFVNVQGAVERSNAYAYEPNKTVNYYLTLAGGLTNDATKEIKITDKNGKNLSIDSIVPSEATIYAEEDTFKTDVTTIASIVAIIASSLAIINGTLDLFGIK